MGDCILHCQVRFLQKVTNGGHLRPSLVEKFGPRGRHSLKEQSQQAFAKLGLSLPVLSCGCFEGLLRQGGALFAKHFLGFVDRTHPLTGFDQSRVRSAQANAEFRIQQSRDQPGLQKLSLFRFVLLDQARCLPHPFFGLSALQILDALDQTQNGQGAFLIAHPALKIGNQTLSPLGQFTLFLSDGSSLVRGIGLHGAPPQGRLHLR